jgi:hypothetical protein
MEKVEVEITTKELLERYNERFADKKDITLKDLSEMKESGISTEMFLEFLQEKYDYLFHGSRNEISFADGVKPLKDGVIFASDNPSVAILKAIYRNNAKNLGYPLNLMEDKSNMVLVIDEPREDTIGEKGYVYVISDKTGFKRDPNSNWQYLKENTAEENTPFVKRVEVERADFKYPVQVN